MSSSLPFQPPLEPMESTSVDVIPEGPEWQYEPKWDGFRCIIFRDGSEVYMQSKSRPLARYFPEVVEHVLALAPRRFVLDGELVIPVKGQLSFDDLLLRLHPAESRVRKLAAEIPAVYIAFDLLANEEGESLLEEPLHARREQLEAFVRKHFDHKHLKLSPSTLDVNEARQWFDSSGGGLDGIMAKLVDAPYLCGERTGMKKYKNMRTADCVVGGFRYGSGTGAASKIMGSLLLGLYDDDGLLHHVGFTSAMSTEERKRLTPIVEALVKPPGFTGRAPGGPSRWSTGRSAEWKPLRPELVVEVQYDHFSGGRFRHGTTLVRWRPDKPARKCSMEQLNTGQGSALALVR